MDNQFKDKKILVFGAGVSGISAARLLAKIGAVPLLYDGGKTEDEIKEKLAPGLKIPIYTKSLPPDDIVKSLALVVVSPGVNLEDPSLRKLTEAGIPVIGEIELAYINARGRIIAITGTNGKTTTVSLVGEIMKAHFSKVFVAGNIGQPFCDIALEATDESIIVLEISSFQLETIKTFTPFIAAILNVTPDHFDRHKTIENYRRIKERIAENQDKTKICVLSLDNEHTALFAPKCPAKVMGFSAVRELNNGCYLKNETIYYCENGRKEIILKTSETKLVGSGNMENIMAAFLIGMEMGISRGTILSAIRNFPPVKHRLEYVAAINGVDYYNDSKATNPDAASHGIKAMTKPTILIAGGSDKKTDYALWLSECRARIKALVLIGETKEAIFASALKAGITKIHKAETMNEAIALSKKIAVCGDAVLLSPACASYDMFNNYEERGDKFKEIVLS
ncbi:MAG: UDP-N-acetylmuramoyl-L-alanine--D-glutamate ligase [Lachnospiraceae bacterium]|nr:UDP-N-acetylmuramoyl-L-alanine--D-glutamate ligase [Lachnospiraceae bacterium]